MWWTRARGESPWSASPRSLTISSAAEASEICDEHAAVTRPPSVRAGSERILSQSGSRGPSSAVHSPSGTISASKRPSSRARMARVWDSTANSSISSRPMSHFSAINSADRNWLTSCVP